MSGCCRDPNLSHDDLAALAMVWGRAVAVNPLRLYLTANLVPFALFAYPACALAGDGFMNPAGAVAQTERQMFFEIATVTAIVVVPVFLLLPWIVWRYRRSAGRGHYSPDWDRSRILEWLVWGIPVLIVAGLA